MSEVLLLMSHGATVLENCSEPALIVALPLKVCVPLKVSASAEFFMSAP